MLRTKTIQPHIHTSMKRSRCLEVKYEAVTFQLLQKTIDIVKGRDRRRNRNNNFTGRRCFNRVKVYVVVQNHVESREAIPLYLCNTFNTKRIHSQKIYRGYYHSSSRSNTPNLRMSRVCALSQELTRTEICLNLKKP